MKTQGAYRYGTEQQGRKPCFWWKGQSNGDISNVSAMHIRAMDFEPFAFRINDNALPELIEVRTRSETRKTGRGKVRPLRTYYRTAPV